MTTTTSRHKRFGWRFVGYLARRAIMMPCFADPRFRLGTSDSATTSQCLRF
jgi:hypothetical protein